ncbi:hypothetical protein RIB2604_00803160 [Aspergillus luchuensis]|uniref:Uncharacterized protein n=1 Tax=Aspergillus kawachii TaxID=1069201 RepID=A0A146F3Z3_ASPKA|nr:hypothetical protein RIB2604_00803160 [Aspergillus luchuensis]
MLLAGVFLLDVDVSYKPPVSKDAAERQAPHSGVEGNEVQTLEAKRVAQFGTGPGQQIIRLVSATKRAKVGQAVCDSRSNLLHLALLD